MQQLSLSLSQVHSLLDLLLSAPFSYHLVSLPYLRPASVSIENQTEKRIVGLTPETHCHPEVLHLAGQGKAACNSLSP